MFSAIGVDLVKVSAILPLKIYYDLELNNLNRNKPRNI